MRHSHDLSRLVVRGERSSLCVCEACGLTGTEEQFDRVRCRGSSDMIYLLERRGVIRREPDLSQEKRRWLRRLWTRLAAAGLLGGLAGAIASYIIARLLFR